MRNSPGEEEWGEGIRVWVFPFYSRERPYFEFDTKVWGFFFFFGKRKGNRFVNTRALSRVPLSEGSDGDGVRFRERGYEFFVGFVLFFSGKGRTRNALKYYWKGIAVCTEIWRIYLLNLIDLIINFLSWKKVGIFNIRMDI